MRFELTTSTLARLRSTPELRPHEINYVRPIRNLWQNCGTGIDALPILYLLFPIQQEFLVSPSPFDNHRKLIGIFKLFSHKL